MPAAGTTLTDVSETYVAAGLGFGMSGSDDVSFFRV